MGNYNIGSKTCSILFTSCVIAIAFVEILLYATKITFAALPITWLNNDSAVYARQEINPLNSWSKFSIYIYAN